jgi:hypothetical protein
VCRPRPQAGIHLLGEHSGAWGCSGRSGAASTAAPARKAAARAPSLHIPGLKQRSKHTFLMPSFSGCRGLQGCRAKRVRRTTAQRPDQQLRHAPAAQGATGPPGVARGWGARTGVSVQVTTVRMLVAQASRGSYAAGYRPRSSRPALPRPAALQKYCRCCKRPLSCVRKGRAGCLIPAQIVQADL